MSNATAETPAPIASRTTADGHRVVIDPAGCLAHSGGTFTRHAGLSVADALVVAEAVVLFDRAEMPALAGAAARLAKRGPLSLWPLVEAAALASHRAGTRPSDMPAPVRVAQVAVWTPAELRARATWALVMPRGTVRVEVPVG